ncbi:hypothetical protein [Mycobacterium avium]|uniref:hypothetical protein n=1 Tax=Mycobacterium avium TaxID=1764 RepID=UPI003F774C19
MAKHADGGDGPVSGPADDSPAVEEARGQTQNHSTDEAVDDYADIAVQKRRSNARFAIAASVVALVALGCLAGWLGYRTYDIRQAQVQRNHFVQAARQGAVNLTTIDYAEMDADIQRILDSSTGSFHDDFQKGSRPFVDVVRQAKSKSEGTVTEAGLESQHGDQAQVLVIVAVKTTNAGAPDQEPRAWRMRIGVQKVGDGAKVSAVQFVP